MNHTMPMDETMNTSYFPSSMSYNNYLATPTHYQYPYNIKHEPSYLPVTDNNVESTYPCSSVQSIPDNKESDTTHKDSTIKEQKQDIKPVIGKRVKKLKGKTSTYWNIKIDDKDFKFFGCAICDISFKQLRDLDSHIATEHNSERLSSYDLRKLNKLKNKGKKKKSKKSKKIKMETMDIEIKPEDGYIGNEKATNFTDGDQTTSQNDDKTSIVKQNEPENENTANSTDNQKVAKIYKCYGCNKLFAMSYYLRLHVRSHTGEKPYSCKVCGESFITASKRGRHNKRVHLSVKHQCRICFRQFSRFELLTAHFDKRHLEDKLEGEVYDYFAILPYMKELEDELKLKLEQTKPKTEDLWPVDDVIDENKPEKTELKVEVDTKKEEDYPQAQIEGVTFEEIKVYNSDDEVKVKIEADDEVEPADDGEQMDDGGDDKDNLSDEDYFPSNTWAASPKIEPEPTPDKKPSKRNEDGSQTCSICNKVIKTSYYMVIHMRTHTGEKPYKCYVCARGFITASKMNRHVLTHTEEEKKIIKTENGINQENEVADEQNLITPKKRRRSKTTPKVKKAYRKRQFSCQYCSQTFYFKDTLEVHLKSHEGQQLVYKCRFCLEEMVDKNGLEEHEKTHGGLKPYLCTICGKQYTKRETMVYHRKGHETSHNFSCDICSKTFKAKCQLRRHLAAHSHTKYILRYECPVCAHMFNTKYHIQMHLHTHQKEGLIVEENRNEILAMVLQNARKIPKDPQTPLTTPTLPPEDDRSRICNICGEIFTHFYYLEEHLKSHGSKITLLDEEKEEVKKYICKICNKGFKLHYYLKLHSFTHTKERPYICQQCGKGFITKGKLKRHIETHSGWKKYQCHICCKFFTRPSYLRIHIRTIHGTQDYNFRLDKSYVSGSGLDNMIGIHN